MDAGYLHFLGRRREDPKQIVPCECAAGREFYKRIKANTVRK